MALTIQRDFLGMRQWELKGFGISNA